MRIIHLTIFIYLIFLNLMISFSHASTISSQELEKFSKTKQWRSILHYKSNLFGQEYSIIEKDSRFYLSSDGYTNAYAELLASVQIFNAPQSFIKKYNGHPQCYFPARYNLLKPFLDKEIKDVHCINLIKWKNFIKADKVALIFASQFISNPASIMGHTFLKFIENRRIDYLNITLGYAANIPEKIGAFNYIYKGLFGGFTGIISETPYFRKVYEYNNMEQRDIWEFNLNLTKSQINQLLNHIWELKHNAKITYFFMDENCSYIILAMIQAVVPQKDLLRDFPIYVLPHETARRLHQEGLISDTSFKPSIRDILVHKYNNLSNTQKDYVLDSLEKFEILDGLETKSIDVLLEYSSLKNQREQGKLKPKWKEFKNKLLLKRSKLPKDEKTILPTPPSPINAHHNFYIEYGFGERLDNEVYHQLILRPGFHKQMDFNAGFLKNSSLNFFEANFKYHTKNKSFKLDQFDFVDVANITPFTWIDPIFSWKFNARYTTSNDYTCINCNFYDLTPAIGISNNLSKIFDLHCLLLTSIQLGHDLQKSIRTWPGLEITLAMTSKSLTFSLSQTALKEVIEDKKLSKFSTTLQLQIHNIIPQLHIHLKSEYNYITKKIRNNHDNSINILHDF